MAREVAAWQGDNLLATATVEPGEQRTTLDLSAAAGPVHVYLPMHMRPVPCGVLKRPSTRTWIAYGDSITGTWSSPLPGSDWVSRSARALGINAINLGFAGAARGELAVATDIANSDADLISIAFGTNCWSLVPHSPQQLQDVTAQFLAEVRRGHPHVQIVVISPIVRPAGETTQNACGAILADLRSAVEAAALERTSAGDGALTLIPGLDLLPPGLLCDGIHPSAEGHAAYTQALLPTLRAALGGAK
jgi:lysophospholipase L1-like esterase